MPLTLFQRDRIFGKDKCQPSCSVRFLIMRSTSPRMSPINCMFSWFMAGVPHVSLHNKPQTYSICWPRLNSPVFVPTKFKTGQAVRSSPKVTEPTQPLPRPPEAVDFKSSADVLRRFTKNLGPFGRLLLGWWPRSAWRVRCSRFQFVSETNCERIENDSDMGAVFPA